MTDRLREALASEVHLKALSGTTLEPLIPIVQAARAYADGHTIWWCEDKRRIVGQQCYRPVNAPELHAECGQMRLSKPMEET